jgi:hypothetical protein
LRPKGGPALDPGTVALQESEAALADEATPRLIDAVVPEPATAQARREKRQQRRRSRPHGRAR